MSRKQLGRIAIQSKIHHFIASQPKIFPLRVLTLKKGGGVFLLLACLATQGREELALTALVSNPER